MNDGTSMGIDAKRALSTILGGEPAPTENEHQTREQVRERLGKAPRFQDLEVRREEREEDYGELHFKGEVEVLYYHGKPIDYGDAADCAARAINDFLEAYPEYVDAPADDEYPDIDWSKVNSVEEMPKAIRRGLYELMKENGYDLGILGLTGFQWGFAYNTARYVRFEEGQPNPAIIDAG